MCVKLRLLFFIITFLFTTNHIKSQSTCPVVQDQQQQQQQKCKCGIKTDGQIYIYCARKSLTKIPKFIRSSILYDELILSGNQITQIQNSSFNGIRVKNLYLDDNRISYIDNQAFSELANYLEQLVIDIDQSAVSATQVQIKPPDSIFDNLLNLKILKLNGFFMNELNNTVFNKTRKLEQLYLINCKLMTVNRFTFASIDNTIKEINFDDNYLSEASLFNLFKQVNYKFKRLQLLSLSRNRIKRLNSIKDVIEEREDNDEVSIKNTGVVSIGGRGDSDGQLVQPFAVDLSYNELSYVDTNAFYSIDRRITKLKMNNNELTNLKFIKNFINLRELYLDYNRVSNLNEFQFRYLTKLEVLSFKGNLLHTISSPNTFTGLNLCLKKLNLAKNSLKYVSDSVFKQTSKLKELYLDKNELGRNLTEQTFSGLESELKLLSLEDNLLNNNDLKSIVDLRNVETLYLSNNNLTNDYENDNSNRNVFDKYVNLTNLYLDRNNFKRIPYFKSAALNNSLLTLSLESNQICHVNTANIKRTYSKLKYFNLNTNKLNCDCNLVDFWLYTQKYLIIDDDNRINLYWKCKSPSRLSDRLFTSVNINEFICDKNDIKPNDCEFDYDFDQQQQQQKQLEKGLTDKSDSFIRRSQTTTTTTTTTTSNTTQSSSSTNTATSISNTNDGGLSTSSRLLLKYLNINQLSADTIKIMWQINDDFIENDSNADKTTANKLISFFKITYRQLINKNHHHSHDDDEYDNDESSVENNSYDDHHTTTSTGGMIIANTEYGQLHTEVLLNNQREFVIENLKLNRIYELCFYIISEFKTNYEEKTCHLIKTNSAISTVIKQKSVNLLSSGMHSNMDTQTTKLLQKGVSAGNGNSGISEFKFETKQIVVGSLIGAMSVLLIVFFILYIIRSSNKSNNESMNNLNGGDQKLNDDQHFQLQQQQQQQQQSQIQPKQFDLLTSYDHLGQGGTTRPILFIRPINNITTTLAPNTNNNNNNNNNNTTTLNTNNTSVGSLNTPYYSTSQCCYTLPPMPPNMIPPPLLPQSTLVQQQQQQQQQQSQTQLNRCKKQTNKKPFSIKNFFKKRNKSDSQTSPSSQQFSDKQMTMTMTTMCKNQQQLAQQYLLSEIALFPSYIIRQPSGTSSSSSSSSSSSTSSSNSCTPHDTTTSSAFTTFTPMLSTTLETTTPSLDPNQQQLSNNNDPNYLMSQQHMYHEITDTLLSSTRKQHQHQQIAFRNDLFNNTTTTTTTTASPLFYDNNKLKELFI